jgi:hypothetical protein
MPNKNCIYDFSAHLTQPALVSRYDIATIQQGHRPPGAGGLHMPPPPVFGRSVDPISTREPDCAHLITTCPPDLQTFWQPCGDNLENLLLMYDNTCMMLLYMWRREGFCHKQGKFFRFFDFFEKTVARLTPCLVDWKSF